MNEFDSTGEPQLSPEDAQLVDRLLGRIDDAAVAPDAPLSEMIDALPDAERPRARALCELLGQLDRYPVGQEVGERVGAGTHEAGAAASLEDDALIDATLARIDRLDRDFASLPLTEMRERHRSFRFRVPDVVGLAAAILLAVGVLMPVTHRVRMASIDAQCSQNLRSIGLASSTYALDHDGWLPMAAGLGPWDSFSSARNFSLLGDLGYCEHGHLGCPGHGHASEHRGYAYRALDNKNRARIALGPHSGLAADRSIVSDYARSGLSVANLALPSANHGHRGQFLLLGTLDVRFIADPVIRNDRGGMDNIYLIMSAPGAEDLKPGQKTLSPDDHFLY
jgi:hypothetical protein